MTIVTFEENIHSTGSALGDQLLDDVACSTTQTQNRRARRRQGRIASLAPRSGGLRPSLTSPARAGGSHLRRGADTPSLDDLALHGFAVARNRRWTTGVALRVEDVQPSQREHHAEMEAGETRSHVRAAVEEGAERCCSTRASRSGWCSSLRTTRAPTADAILGGARRRCEW